MLYDCFTFFNELDLLELRLNELDSVIDKFVLVEATKTHQFKDKPLYYEMNKERFKKFHDKIIHVIVNEYPSNPDHESWVYERHQRNMIIKGLNGLSDNDFIIISDIDEIPRASILTELQKTSGVKVFKQRMYYYFFNCIAHTGDLNHRLHFWHGSVMVDKKNFSGIPQQYRELSIMVHGKSLFNRKAKLYWGFKAMLNPILKAKNWTIVNEAGWHFSFLGGVDAIIKKIEAFAHSEYNKDEFKDPEKIKQYISEGKDIFGRGFKYDFIPLDNTFPSYLLNNRNKFSNLIAPVTKSL
jgi:beta-1,4-mannosyl-glycoprotein beta-1,4-N-acetylglucosaminyltransferase